MLSGDVGSAGVVRIVYATIRRLRDERALPPREIAPEDRLNTALGLRSMDLARLVLELEDQLGADPFEVVPITTIRSVEDLVTAYVRHLTLDEPIDWSAAAAAPTERSDAR